MDLIGTKLTFYILAVISTASAIMVVSLRNLFHAVLSLALFLLGIAGLYLILQAEFLAILQVFIFVGAVVVLFLFVVMLTEGIGDVTISQTNRQRVPALITTLVILFTLTSVFIATPGLGIKEVSFSSLQEFGHLLLNNYVLPFEALSLVLLIALFGVVILTHKKGKK